MHQLALLKQCRTLEDSSYKPINLLNEAQNKRSELKSKFGIIGDIVGSGKTLSILSIISNKKILENRLPKMIHKGLVTCHEYSLEDYNVLPYSIIVVPHTIFKQWKETIEECTDLKYVGINNKKSFEEFEKSFFDGNNTPKLEADIILIASTRYSEFDYLIRDLPYNFSRYFFDEADILKISSYATIHASFIWFVSSSYKSLLNPYPKIVWGNSNGETSDFYSYEHTIRKSIGGLKNGGYIKNIMANIKEFPNSYKVHLILRNSDEYVRSAFKLQDYLEQIIKCKMPYYLQVLNSNVSQEIMNHINAGDLKGAIDKLDCEKYSECDLIKGVTKDLESKLKNLEIEFEMKSKMVYSSQKNKEDSLAKIFNKINSLKQKITSIHTKLNDSTMCAICYDESENTSVSQCCNTKYCFECISKWLHQKKQCPFCRASLDWKTLILVAETTKVIKEKIDLFSKLDNLKTIIEKRMTEPKFKMLIFSEYNSSFDVGIIDLLKEFNISYASVMGTANTVNKNIRLYKDYESVNKIDVLLLNANYCANGINLENSTDIVLYHSMNKDTTTQIIGRGQRPGRDSQLHIWKLCYENEA
jgi:hypothetical protein